MPPSGTHTMVAVMASVRRRAGVNSAAMVDELGNAPPIPSPARNRNAAMLARFSDKPMQLVARPNSSTLPMIAGRRPKRSHT
jgi:hypothetical protein